MAQMVEDSYIKTPHKKILVWRFCLDNQIKIKFYFACSRASVTVVISHTSVGP